jgi:3-phenylpropionate/cinnamic acid dioxygenase small subunit
VTDLDEIRSLLGRYCELVDAADWDGLGRLFANGTLADQDGNPIARGAEGVATFYGNAIRLYDGSPRTKHIVSNTVVEKASTDGIVARSSYLVLQALDDLPLQPIITGSYRDTFTRTQDGWAFAERRFFVDLVGDLSRHLAYELS